MTARVFSFGADRRIRKRREFLRVQRTGRPVRTAHFVLLVAPREQDGPSRLGVVTTRKLGGAVVRNRIKRLCRESFRLQPALVPAGVDLVVIARSGAEKLGLEQVQREWAGVQGPLRKRCEEALRDAKNRPPPVVSPASKGHLSSR